MNQNYEYFWTVLEQFVDEFTQKSSSKGVLFAEKGLVFAPQLIGQFTVIVSRVG